MCSRNMRKMPRNLHTKNKGKNNNNTARPLGQNETKVYDLVQVYISVLFLFCFVFFLFCIMAAPMTLRICACK